MKTLLILFSLFTLLIPAVADPAEMLESAIDYLNATSLPELEKQAQKIWNAEEDKTAVASFLLRISGANAGKKLLWEDKTDSCFENFSNRILFLLQKDMNEEVTFFGSSVPVLHQKSMLLEVAETYYDYVFLFSGDRITALEKRSMDRFPKMSFSEKCRLAKTTRLRFIQRKIAQMESTEIKLVLLQNNFLFYEAVSVLLKDDTPEIAEKAKCNKWKAFIARSLPSHIGKVSYFRFLETVFAETDKMSLSFITDSFFQLKKEEQDTLINWLAGHLSDLRYAPYPGSDVPVSEHDLSRIGGKCAFLLEQLFSIKLLPVNQHTPLPELEQQKEQILKQLHQNRLEIPSAGAK